MGRGFDSLRRLFFSIHPLSHFTKVLTNRNFFLLWIGQVISQLGDRLSQMALIGLVYQRAPGSAMEIAKILSFTIIPVFLIGPVAGAYVDRWNRRKTMYACDLLRGFLVLLIPLFLLRLTSFMWIYLIIFLTFSLGRFFVPAKLAIVPELVDKKYLVTANSLINTTGMIAAVLGFGISGLIVEMLGPKSGFYLDAFSFLASGALIFFISKKNGHTASVDLKELGSALVQEIKKSIFTDMKEGVIYFVKHAEIRFIAGIIFLLWSALGAVYVVTIAFVQNTLHSATKDLGFLIVFLGIGMFLGSIAYSMIGHRLSQFKIIFFSLILSGIMLALFAFMLNAYPVFKCAASLAVLLGLSVSPVMIASNTIVHKVSDNHMMGKIFSSLEIVMHLAFLIFMFVSGILAERFPQSAILVCIGLLISVAGVVSLSVNRKSQWLS